MIGQFRTVCKVMLLVSALAGRLRPILFTVLSLCAVPVLSPVPSLAQDNPSGLPLPRFVTTRSNPINVRVGPGTKYEVAWNYLVSGVPVEIIQEFDTWRKIRDADGEEGWIHQNLLSGNRAGYAQPLLANGDVLMRANRSAESAPRAHLKAGVRVSVSECDGQWCQVSAGHPGERASYNGWVKQEELWGVYPNEVFD